MAAMDEKFKAWMSKTQEAIIEPDLPIIVCPRSPQFRSATCSVAAGSALRAQLRAAVPPQDPHHHLWDHQGEPGPGRYLIDEIAEDVNSGHNIVKTVRRAFSPQLAPAYASAVQPLPLRLP